MTRTALAIAAITCLAGPAQAAPSPSSARAAALEALAARADLPSAPPLLPSILTDRRAGARTGDADRAGQDRDADARGQAAREARGQAAKEARSEAARAHAAAANAEAAQAAAAASKDARGAVEKKHADRTRKKPKPPHPPRGGGK